MYSRVTPVEQVECEFEVGSHSVVSAAVWLLGPLS